MCSSKVNVFNGARNVICGLSRCGPTHQSTCLHLAPTIYDSVGELEMAAGWLDRYQAFWTGQLDALERFLERQAGTAKDDEGDPR